MHFTWHFFVAMFDVHLIVLTQILEAAITDGRREGLPTCLLSNETWLKQCTDPSFNFTSITPKSGRLHEYQSNFIFHQMVICCLLVNLSSK